MTLSPEGNLKRAKRRLEAAKMLLSNGYNGIAASETYFSMFYVAEALLLKKGLFASKGDEAIIMLGRELVTTGLVPTELYSYLITAKELRLLVDYRGIVLTEQEARLQIKRGHEFLEFAKRFLGHSSS